MNHGYAAQYPTQSMPIDRTSQMKREQSTTVPHQRRGAMSTQQYTIEQYFPTEPWLETYREHLEDSDRLTETGAGWGVGWEGGMVFHITDIPLDERTIADLPEELVGFLDDRIDSLSNERLEEIVAAAPEQVRTDIESRPGSLREQAQAELMETSLSESVDLLWDELEAELPDLLVALMGQIEEHIVDGTTVYSHLELFDGGCEEVAILQDLGEREHGFVITGEYEQWKALVNGDANVISQIMGGKMQVDGDMQKILQYSDAAVSMTETAADTDSRFLF